MYKIIIGIVITLFFVSCSSKTNISPSKKVFEQEDTYIVFALEAERQGAYQTASEFFAKLYEKTTKKEYLYRELQDKMILRDFEDVIKKVDIEQEKLQKIDPNLLRFKVLALVHLKKLNEAKENAIKLAKLTSKSEDYILLADIYLKLKKYDLAVKYLEGAYSKNYDEKILDKISIILYLNLDRKKDAIAQLETHSRMFGCSDLICNRLLSFYSKENDVDGMLSVYKRVYELNKNEEVLKKIIQIYTYKKDFVALEKFLEKYNPDDEILLEVYIANQKLDKASKLSYKLYKETSDIDYLARGAIYEYESTKNISKKQLYSIIKKLKKVIKKKPTGLYLNYLGYLLIDHQVDVKEGMKYIKMALKEKPNSAYYLDSLAWGYYKLGNCKKANKLFKKIVKLEGGDDKEIKKHIKVIDKCLKNRRR
jgi:predicted Zn-dependent protease